MLILGYVIQAVSNGLSEKAAEEFGLNAGTPVGASLIDAHAGGTLIMFIPTASCL